MQIQNDRRCLTCGQQLTNDSISVLPKNQSTNTDMLLPIKLDINSSFDGYTYFELCSNQVNCFRPHDLVNQFNAGNSGIVTKLRIPGDTPIKQLKFIIILHGSGSKILKDCIQFTISEGFSSNTQPINVNVTHDETFSLIKPFHDELSNRKQIYVEYLKSKTVDDGSVDNTTGCIQHPSDDVYESHASPNKTLLLTIKRLPNTKDTIGKRIIISPNTSNEQNRNTKDTVDRRIIISPNTLKRTGKDTIDQRTIISPIIPNEQGGSTKDTVDKRIIISPIIPNEQGRSTKDTVDKRIIISPIIPNEQGRSTKDTTDKRIIIWPNLLNKLGKDTIDKKIIVSPNTLNKPGKDTTDKRIIILPNTLNKPGKDTIDKRFIISPDTPYKPEKLLSQKKSYKTQYHTTVGRHNETSIKKQLLETNRERMLSNRPKLLQHNEVDQNSIYIQTLLHSNLTDTIDSGRNYSYLYLLIKNNMGKIMYENTSASLQNNITYMDYPYTIKDKTIESKYSSISNVPDVYSISETDNSTTNDQSTVVQIDTHFINITENVDDTNKTEEGYSLERNVGYSHGNNNNVILSNINLYGLALPNLRDGRSNSVQYKGTPAKTRYFKNFISAQFKQIEELSKLPRRRKTKTVSIGTKDLMDFVRHKPKTDMKFQSESKTKKIHTFAASHNQQKSNFQIGPSLVWLSGKPTTIHKIRSKALLSQNRFFRPKLSFTNNVNVTKHVKIQHKSTTNYVHRAKTMTTKQIEFVPFKMTRKTSGILRRQDFRKRKTNTGENYLPRNQFMNKTIQMHKQTSYNRINAKGIDRYIKSLVTDARQRKPEIYIKKTETKKQAFRAIPTNTQLNILKAKEHRQLVNRPTEKLASRLNRKVYDWQFPFLFSEQTQQILSHSDRVQKSLALSVHESMILSFELSKSLSNLKLNSQIKRTQIQQSKMNTYVNQSRYINQRTSSRKNKWNKKDDALPQLKATKSLYTNVERIKSASENHQSSLPYESKDLSVPKSKQNSTHFISDNVNNRSGKLLMTSRVLWSFSTSPLAEFAGKAIKQLNTFRSSESDTSSEILT